MNNIYIRPCTHVHKVLICILSHIQDSYTHALDMTLHASCNNTIVFKHTHPILNELTALIDLSSSKQSLKGLPLRTLGKHGHKFNITKTPSEQNQHACIYSFLGSSFERGRDRERGIYVSHLSKGE